jgi:hypothetical protein
MSRQPSNPSKVYCVVVTTHQSKLCVGKTPDQLQGEVWATNLRKCADDAHAQWFRVDLYEESEAIAHIRRWNDSTPNR